MSEFEVSTENFKVLFSFNFPDNIYGIDLGTKLKFKVLTTDSVTSTGWFRALRQIMKALSLDFKNQYISFSRTVSNRCVWCIGSSFLTTKRGVWEVLYFCFHFKKWQLKVVVSWPGYHPPISMREYWFRWWKDVDIDLADKENLVTRESYPEFEALLDGGEC